MSSLRKEGGKRQPKSRSHETVRRLTTVSLSFCSTTASFLFCLAEEM